MWINVILAIDERLPDVRKCVASLRKFYGPGVKIALATYGNPSVGPQPAVTAYAEENGFLYYDVPRHDFLTEDDTKEWHACEILVRMQITKHFADFGYDEIYIMHSDIQATGDFRIRFKEKANGLWSFIAILVRAHHPFDYLCQKGSWGLYFDGNEARLGDMLVRYNSAFVAQVYAKYGDPVGIWENWLSKFTIWGDLAQFDLAREWFGFTGRYFQDKSDFGAMVFGTVLHSPKQAIPACLPEGTRNGTDRLGILNNYERRVCAK